MKVGTQGTKPEGGGRYVDKAGLFHFVVNQQSIDTAGNGEVLRSEVEVVGGEHDDQVGKTVSYDLFLPEGSQYPEDNASNLLRFGCALGIYSKQQWAADRESGIAADVPVDEASGLQFVGKVEMKPDKNDKTKHWARITRVYAVGDDEVQGVPMSVEHLAVYGGKLPRSEGGFRQAGANGATNGQSASNRPSPQQPPAGDDDDLF